MTSEQPHRQPQPDRVGPIPDAINGLLTLFASDLADVRFGDLDRAALEDAAASVEAAAAALAEAELVAAAARAALEAAQDDLARKGQRALAYARIYAEASPPLAQRLAAISFTPGARLLEVPVGIGGETTTRRRGRPAKPSNEASGSLPLEPVAPSSSEPRAPDPRTEPRPPEPRPTEPRSARPEPAAAPPPA